MRHHQKIAVARLISDLINADDVICRDEIALYNKIVQQYDITQEELYEAQYLSLAEAIMCFRHMSKDEQKNIYVYLKKAIYSDQSCVAREALLLLTLSMVINDTDNKYLVFSTKLRGKMVADKYVMYIESDYMPLINEEIAAHYDQITNLLHLWKFDFIYIPNHIKYFREMDRKYLCDILRYMNPRLTNERIEDLYGRLTQFTTEQYTRECIGNACQEAYFNELPPSLIINIGSSHVPANSHMPQEGWFMNLMTIRLDDEENAVLKEVQRFIAEYEKYITEHEYYRPLKGKKLFRYQGFNKQLFDFLMRRQTNGLDNSIVVDVPSRRIWMRGIEIQMSATLLATYVFVLHQTLCTSVGGLMKVRMHYPLSDKDLARLAKTYHLICNLFRDVPVNEERQYMDDVNNVRGYIARLRTIIAHHFDDQDINYYYPKNAANKMLYQVCIDADKVRIRDSYGEYAFTEYPLWKTLK